MKTMWKLGSRLEITPTMLCHPSKSVYIARHSWCSMINYPSGYTNRYVVVRAYPQNKYTFNTMLPVTRGYAAQLSAHRVGSDLVFACNPWGCALILREYKHPRSREISLRPQPLKIKMMPIRCLSADDCLSVAAVAVVTEKLQSSFKATSHVPPLES